MRSADKEFKKKLKRRANVMMVEKFGANLFLAEYLFRTAPPRPNFCTDREAPNLQIKDYEVKINKCRSPDFATWKM